MRKIQRPMRKKIRAFMALLCFLLALYASIEPAVKYVIQQKIESVFKDSQVSLGACRLRPAHRLSIAGIRISNGKSYEIRAEEFIVRYNFLSIIQRKISNISIINPAISVNMPERNISALMEEISLDSSSAFEINSLEVKNLNVDCDAKDLKTNFVLSAIMDLGARSLDSLRMEIENLESKGFSLNQMSLETGENLPEGVLNIGTVRYNKLTLDSIKGDTVFNGRKLDVKIRSGRVLDGDVYGDLSFQASKDAYWNINLKLDGLNIERLVDVYDLKDKFEMTGVLNGGIVLSGNVSGIMTLAGELASDSMGGLLVIKDTRFLENMARKTNQPAGIVVDTFKNYRYNTGLIKLALEDSNLTLNMFLDGDAGKRDLNIVLHDFK